MKKSLYLLIALMVLFFAISCKNGVNSTDQVSQVAGFDLNRNIAQLTDSELKDIADELNIDLQTVKDFIQEKQSGDSNVEVPLSDLIKEYPVPTINNEDDDDNDTGELSGVFTVKSRERVKMTGNEKEDFEEYTYKIRFAKGNLYHTGTNANSGWEFEKHQYDYRTYDNAPAVISGKSTTTKAGDCGLLYWAEKDKNQRSYCLDYKLTKEEMETLDEEYDFTSDSMTIFTNASTASGEKSDRFKGSESVKGSDWFTLGYNEWIYILYMRPCGKAEGSDNNEALLRNGFATLEINESTSVKGFVILPDDWTLPEGCKFTSHWEGCGRPNRNDGSIYYSGKDKQGAERNVYTLSDWKKMEKNGAVFLPMAGYRTNNSRDVKKNDLGAYYWTSTPSPAMSEHSQSFACGFYKNSSSQYDIGINSKWIIDDIENQKNTRDYGFAIRLVQKVN